MLFHSRSPPNGRFCPLETIRPKAMGGFVLIFGMLHYLGLYIQLNGASKPDVDAEADNHISGNALFTEVPHDITTQSGQDVEMACSFRGAGPSYSLEIQWWYMKNHKDWPEKPAWTTNQVVPMEEMSKDATKISVVKVAGSNISHKLRLSSVKRSDEGSYECRVIDFSGSVAQLHRVRAYLQVEAEQSPGHGSGDTQALETRHRGQGSEAHPDQREGRELKRRSTGDSATECSESCAL
ncbi:hypothetical protein DPEC_G00196460 [Dallia pectoralis]|uniref:Uncharacterized protein n=1 Tax=Dallia pectoralis TaxID=75939 RepID=A0ACC2G7T3_DALPE|nr:hypothetical protein DPEC_G00196460 [Dallia pectoralis]